MAVAAVGALVGTLMLPEYYASAETTAISTIYETATNTANNSVGASSDAPGGRKTGTAKPGDTIKWVVPYANNTSANASVNLQADLHIGSQSAPAGTYVPGSLQLPSNLNALGTLTPQYTAPGDQTWTSGTPPANATGVGYTGTLLPTRTRQLSLNFPSPTGTTLATVGGDGYNAVTRGNLTYAVFHHKAGDVVYCALQNGATCPGWPTNQNAQRWSTVVGTPIGTGAAIELGTAWQNGTWISGNKLFWLMGTWDNSSTGTACLDLSTTTPTSCGYTVLTTNPINNSQWAHIGASGIPASNGNIYAVASGGRVNGTGTYSYVCISPSTGASCGTLQIMSGVTSSQALQATTFGDRVFASVQQTSTSSWQTYCYVAGGQLCTGSWPVTSSTSAALGGNVYAPILSTTGTLTGVCTIANGAGSSTSCWSLSGAPAPANPYAGTGAFYNVTTNTSGDVFRSGTRVYVSTGNTVMCRDFAQWSGTGAVPACAGFTNPTNNKNYTVRSAASIAPNCLVADSDSGQITFFNAITGGGCVGTSGPSTMTVTPASSYCGSGAAGFTGWGTLSLPGLVVGTYSNSSVTLRDQNDAIIAGFDNVTLAAGGTLSLAGIPTTVTSISATVTVNGVNDPSGVTPGQISVSWNGSPPELCFETVAPPVSCDAPAPTRIWSSASAVTTSAGGSDAPSGNSAGGGTSANQADFLVSADPSQCSLAITKTPSAASARPGDTVTYMITVRNTGTQAYDNASFTDDLSDVLQDATFNDDQSASTGTVSYASPNLSWSGPLAAGAAATITYSAKVRNPDPGDHRMINTVVSPTIGSNCASGSSDADCTANVPVSDLTVTKTADSASVQSPARVGDVITYDFTAHNTGQTTLDGVTIADAHPGLGALVYTWPSPANAGRLLPGQTVTATATYALTQADIDAGLVQNTATATGNPPTGPPVTTPPSGVQVPLDQGPELSLTKSANSLGVADPAAVGNTIEYTFVATNTGKATPEYDSPSTKAVHAASFESGESRVRLGAPGSGQKRSSPPEPS
ncbi:DUF7507 domain-containing protein [Leifsonia virtsii]|uniref:DUF11 domain-containing protein n=1 Tax=Leifsonia virtsii TaxID=3035915 RepID=A0ABT8IZR6_9MICO|nr:hypothetical protein [Leifsonia virtsii]MDN4597886.1 hypothetical protein [Leifsonia virtsii]